eukprot:UN21465
MKSQAYQIHNLQAREGGTSCMADYGPITTNKECEAAALALGYVYNGEALSSASNRLPYCWFGFENSLVNFNPTGDFGSDLENSPARLVCKTLAAAFNEQSVGGVCSSDENDADLEYANSCDGLTGCDADNADCIDCTFGMGTCVCFCADGYTSKDGETCVPCTGEVEQKVTLNTYSLLLNKFEYVLFYGLALVGLLTILAFLRFAFQNNEYKTVVDEMSKLEELSAEI